MSNVVGDVDMKTVEDKVNEKAKGVLGKLEGHPAKEALSEVISEYEDLLLDYAITFEKGSEKAPKALKMVEIDNFSKHTTLDMAWFFASSVCRELAEHPYIEQDEELSDLAQKSIDALMALYQKLGEKILPLKEE